MPCPTPAERAAAPVLYRALRAAEAAWAAGERVTTLNLKVVQIDVARGLVLVEGSVPGAKGSLVLISDAKKHPRPKDAPFPAGLKTSAQPAAEAEAKKD